MWLPVRAIQSSALVSMYSGSMYTLRTWHLRASMGYSLCMFRIYAFQCQMLGRQQLTLWCAGVVTCRHVLANQYFTAGMHVYAAVESVRMMQMQLHMLNHLSDIGNCAFCFRCF
jgi:hypothetical protein